MVDNVYPVDAVAGAPSYTGRKLRQTRAVLHSGATAARPLGSRSGVRPGTPSTTASVSGFTWSVAAHAGTVDAQTAAEAGAYDYAFDAAAGGTITAAGAGVRGDILYVQVDDPAESDGTSVPAATRKYLAGTAGGANAVLPARSMLLATISVPTSGGGNPTVTWKAPYTAAAGGVTPVTDPTAGTGDYPASPYLGQIVDDSVLGVTRRWDGTDWVFVTPRVFHLREEQTSGTAGGTFTSGSFVKRTLNTTVKNNIVGGSVASSVVTLPAGKYDFEAWAPCYFVDQNKLKLRQTSGTPADLVVGASQMANSAGGVSESLAHIKGSFTLTASSTVEVQHRCTTTRASNGLGVSAGFSIAEVYTEAVFTRVA